MNSSKFSYQTNDVCIIGYGCVLPDAPTPEQYWENLNNGHSALSEVLPTRWDTEAHFDPSHQNSDKTYANQGCFVSDEIINSIETQLGITHKQTTRLNLMALESCRQALRVLNTDEIATSKIDIILGCMAADESIAHRALSRECKKTLRQLAKEKTPGWEHASATIDAYLRNHIPVESIEEDVVVNTSVLHHIKKRFDIKGEATLIDAACASSLAAIDNAVARLQSGQCDIALSGGIEGDLGASTFALFCSVGAHSKTNCYPFDKKATGLIQGEGAVIFVLQRLEDALTQNKKVYGIIKGCGSSSDGRCSSLFSPSVPGQMLAFQRAYRAAGNTPPDYIECHGTGTSIGDTTELTSLSAFFAKSDITIGSSKAYIGHTKGAAGAAGLLKCLLAMEHRTIPPSHYFEELAEPTNSIHVNREKIRLPDKNHLLRMGVSSFGFGNINYHLILDEFSQHSSIRIATQPPSPEEFVIVDEIVLDKTVVGKIGTSPDDIRKYLANANLSIPPLSIPQTDPLQLQAVMGTIELLKQAGIHYSQLDTKSISVIAASCTGLPKAWEFCARVGYDGLLNKMKSCSIESQQFVQACKQRLTPVTEDIGPGILNNIIAAKVSNTFNFTGTNYNVDADQASLAMALDSARQELNKGSSAVIIIHSLDHITSGQDGMTIERQGLHCILLTTKSTALEKSYPIKSILKKNRYTE